MLIVKKNMNANQVRMKIFRVPWKNALDVVQNYWT